MDKTEFLLRFQLHQAIASEDPLQAQLHNHPKWRDAAVLIALEEYNGELHVWLTERTAQMPTHAGQIAFPGGKVDSSDHSYWHTALRESWEEIGLPPQHVQRIGELPVLHTVSHFRIFPQIGFITQPFAAQLSEREVARLFRVPLRDFLIPKQRWYLPVSRQAQTQKVYFMPHHVWGATAAMIEQLARHLGFSEARLGP